MKIKPQSTDKRLESFRIFPYIAWALVISFSLFVYNLGLKLQKITDELERISISNQQMVDIDPAQSMTNSTAQ